MTVNGRMIGGPPGPDERDPGLDRVYRETERDLPPAHLDAAIRAAARREVGARPRPLASALRRWRVPVSIAALVVLSVSLVTLVQEEGGDEVMKVAPTPPSAPKPFQAAPPPAPQRAEADVAGASVPAPVRPAPADDRRAGSRGELGTMADRAQRESVTPAPQPFPATPRVEERAAVSAQAEPSMEESYARAPAVAPQSGARSAAAGAPAAKVESADALSRPVPSAAPVQAKMPPWQGYEKEPPQKWLDRIAELGRQGETAAAGEMLAEFKRRFPEHPLPPDPGAR